MKRLSNNSRTLIMVGSIAPLIGLFAYVALKSGPMAPIPVTVATIESRAITPALFGVGSVEARYTYKIGPTVAGRVKTVHVHVGDRVKAGQLLGEMDPVDFDDRIAAQSAAIKRAEAQVSAATAQAQEALARRNFTASQTRRYEELWKDRWVSEEAVEAKRQEGKVAEAGLTAASSNLEAARQELSRIKSDREALILQRANLRLVAPVDGLVSKRDVDPGVTLVAGQAVVEIIDTTSLWINARFDQLRVAGLTDGLKAQIALRSQNGQKLAGRVSRLEPLADSVTEETLAKVVFDSLPEPLPPVGELVEVTIALPTAAPAPTVPNASIKRVNGRLGVWLIKEGSPIFAPVKVGATDLDGMAQITDGVKPGDRVVVYSQRAIDGRSDITVVERLPGV